MPVITNHRKERFPQLGAPGERYTVKEKATGQPKMTAAGYYETAIRFPGGVDLSGRVERAAAMATFAHSLRTAHPEAVRSGMQWYPKVNEATMKGIGTGRGSRGFLRAASDREMSGAGLVASVSPNMDWDAANIHALGEMRGLRSKHWDAIMGGSKQEAADAVSGLSLAKAPRGNLQKAGRLVRGEDPHAVIPEESAPKTHAFMHNIADPSNPHHVTIDARAYDTLTNRMRPWEFNRLLTTKPEGAKETRYDQAQGIVQAVSKRFDMDPSAAQATSWENVKYHVERGGVTNRGQPRKQGPTRLGQPYYHPQTGEPVAHMSSQFNVA